MTTDGSPGKCRAIPVLVCVLVGMGCTKKDSAPGPRLNIGSVQLLRRGKVLSGVSEEKIESWVRGRLSGSRWIRLDAREGDLFDLSLEHGVARDSGDPGRELWLLALRAAADRPGAPVLQAHLAIPVGGEAVARRGVERVMDDLLQQAQAAVIAPAALPALLHQEKDAIRLAALVDIAASRRVRETLPVLTRLLRHADPRVADRSIGALVSLGDRRAVHALTRLSKLKDTAKLAKLIDAIATLGGQEAQDFLEFVGTGHEDQDIRNMAREALQRMKNRKD